MARGKYATRSAASSARDDLQTEVVSLRRRLTAAESALTEERTARADEKSRLDGRVVALAADVTAGASDRVRDLEREVLAEREVAGGLRMERDRVLLLWQKASDRLFEHFSVDHHMAGPSATNAVLDLIQGDDLADALLAAGCAQDEADEYRNGIGVVSGHLHLPSMNRLSPETRDRLVMAEERQPGIVYDRLHAPARDLWTADVHD